MSKEKLTYTVAEAADLIGVSKVTMYNLIHSENCNFAFNIGRKIIISRPALERWIDESVKQLQ